MIPRQAGFRLATLPAGQTSGSVAVTCGPCGVHWAVCNPGIPRRTPPPAACMAGLATCRQARFSRQLLETTWQRLRAGPHQSGVA